MLKHIREYLFPPRPDCKDCAHYEANNHLAEVRGQVIPISIDPRKLVHGLALCQHPFEAKRYADEARHVGSCGRKGKYFQPKEKKDG